MSQHAAVVNTSLDARLLQQADSQWLHHNAAAMASRIDI